MPLFKTVVAKEFKKMSLTNGIQPIPKVMILPPNTYLPKTWKMEVMEFQNYKFYLPAFFNS